MSALCGMVFFYWHDHLYSDLSDLIRSTFLAPTRYSNSFVCQIKFQNTDEIFLPLQNAQVLLDS